MDVDAPAGIREEDDPVRYHDLVLVGSVQRSRALVVPAPISRRLGMGNYGASLGHRSRQATLATSGVALKYPCLLCSYPLYVTRGAREETTVASFPTQRKGT